MLLLGSTCVCRHCMMTFFMHRARRLREEADAIGFKILPADEVRVAAWQARHSQAIHRLMKPSLSLYDFMSIMVGDDCELFDFLAAGAERLRAMDVASGALVSTRKKYKTNAANKSVCYAETLHFATDMITAQDVFHALLACIAEDDSVIGRDRFKVVWPRVGAQLSADDIDKWTSILFARMRKLISLGQVVAIDDLLYPFRPKSNFQLILTNPSKPNPHGVGGDAAAVKLHHSKKTLFVDAILRVVPGAKMPCSSTMLELLRRFERTMLNVGDSGFLSLEGVVLAANMTPPCAILGSIKKDNMPKDIVTLGSHGLGLNEVRVVEFLHQGARIAASFKAIQSDKDDNGLKPLNQPKRDLHIIVTTAYTIGAPDGKATGLTIAEMPFDRNEIDKFAALGLPFLKKVAVRQGVEIPRLGNARTMAMVLCGVAEEDVPPSDALPSYQPPSTRAHGQSDAVAKWADVTDESVAKMSVDELKSKLVSRCVPLKSNWRKPELAKALLDAKRRATSTTSSSAAIGWLDAVKTTRAPSSAGHLHEYYRDEMNAIDNGDEHMAYLRPSARLRGDAKRALVINTLLMTMSNLYALWCERLASTRQKLPSTMQFVKQLYAAVVEQEARRQ